MASSTRVRSPRRPALRAHLKPHHKLWLNWDGAFLMGPRYLSFLDAVDRTGTIRAAGQGAAWGYRPGPTRTGRWGRARGPKVLAPPRAGPPRGAARRPRTPRGAGSRSAHGT